MGQTQGDVSKLSKQNHTRESTHLLGCQNSTKTPSFFLIIQHSAIQVFPSATSAPPCKGNAFNILQNFACSNNDYCCSWWNVPPQANGCTLASSRRQITTSSFKTDAQHFITRRKCAAITPASTRSTRQCPSHFKSSAAHVNLERCSHWLRNS